MNTSKKIVAPAKQVVIHVVTSLDFGGVEKHIEILGCVAHEGRMFHRFCAIGDGGATANVLQSMGAKVDCLKKPFNIPSFPAFWSLYRFFRDVRPTVVHTYGAEANFHGLLAAWLARVPVRIGEEIGIPDHGRKAKGVFRLIYGTAHRVIGVSDAVRQWLIASHEVSSNKAKLIYNPVQLPTLDERTTVPHDVFRIGFVGRLEAVKNPLALLDAFGAIVATGVPCELWLVGDGSERAELEQRISKKGLIGKVRLFGYQSDPASLIRQCHVYVQPSLSEGFGIALVEAMGCGLPVIATAVGGAPEIIDHGKTGWLLLPQASPDLIAASLGEALRLEPEKLREMGLRARQSVEGRFEPSSHLAQLEKLYVQIAEERGIQVA